MAKDALILALPCVCYACMLTNSPTVNGSGNSDPFQRWAPVRRILKRIATLTSFGRSQVLTRGQRQIDDRAESMRNDRF